MILIATLSGNLIAFLANLYLSAKLGPANFGIFKTIIYLFVFLPSLVNLGIQVVLPKYIAEFKAKNSKKIGHLIMSFMKWRFVAFLLLAILIVLFRHEISIQLFDTTEYDYLILAGLPLFFSLFFMVFPFIVQGFQKFRLFSITFFLAFALPPITAIVLLPFGLLYMILGLGIATGASYLVPIRFLLKEKVFSTQVKFSMKKILWSFAMPMHGLYFVMALPSVAVPFFSLFFVPVTVGYFAYSLMFYTAALLIPGVVSIVVLPKISELVALKKYKDANSMLRKAFLMYTPIAIVGSLGVLLLSNWFLTIISPEYLPSLPLFNALVVLGLFSGYGLIYSSYLQGRGKIRRTAIVIVAVNILLFLVSWVILNYVL